MTTLTVNGSSVSVSAPPDSPLLTVLRDELGLVGTRFGCGLGQCGACFVNLDGVVVASCDTPLWQAEGGSVTTVEGLTPHPVQEAFLEHQAAQCGFCISGMVVSAAALLERDPTPSRAEVAAALERNLCRCGSHNRIVAAICGAGS